MRENDGDGIRRAAWQMVTDTATHRVIAEKVRERRRSSRTLAMWVARVSQWLSPRDPHQLPANDLDLLIEECVAHGGTDQVTPLLHRAAMRGEDRWREAELGERRGPLRVPPRRREDRRRA